MIKIKIPATSANLGPGFDCLGISYTLCNVYKVKKAKSMLIEGCNKKYTTKSNVFNRAFQKTMKMLGKKGSFHVYYEETIPASRGLGSSASVIVAGCMAANRLYGGLRKLNKDEIFNIAANVEGHPDNVAPAIYGGLTVTAKLTDKSYHCSKYKVSHKLHFTILIPDFKTSTEKSRKVLPNKYKKEDVISTISHSILMVDALQTGNMKLLKSISKDYVHEPYRKKLIRDYDYIKKTIEKNYDAVVLISGSGPSLLVISKDRHLHKKIKLTNTKANWEIKPLKIKQ